MTAEPTIFGRILDGEIPCHRVYEDEHVLAFLDVGPLSLGHVLVIPKERVAFLHELSDDAAAAIGRVLPRIARGVDGRHRMCRLQRASEQWRGSKSGRLPCALPHHSKIR